MKASTKLLSTLCLGLGFAIPALADQYTLSDQYRAPNTLMQPATTGNNVQQAAPMIQQHVPVEVEIKPMQQQQQAIQKQQTEKNPRNQEIIQQRPIKQ